MKMRTGFRMKNWSVMHGEDEDVTPCVTPGKAATRAQRSRRLRGVVGEVCARKTGKAKRKLAMTLETVPEGSLDPKVQVSAARPKRPRRVVSEGEVAFVVRKVFARDV
jgi:hypothetical protein